MTGSGDTARDRLVIGLDFIADEGWMGGAIYLRNLVYCLASLPEHERPDIRLLGVPDPENPIAKELRSFPFVDRGIPPAAGQAGRRRFWTRVKRRLFQSVLPPEPEWRGLDATYPSFGHRIAGAAAIRWIPDLQHLHLPHLFTDDEYKARTANMARIAETRGVLVLSSEAARTDFVAAFPDPRIDIRVWRFCSVITDHERGGANPHDAYGLPRKYIYLPNQFWAHKNHITAFRALARAIASGHDISLVCTGLEADRRDPGHMPRLRAFLEEHGLERHVRLLGLVPRKDQIEIFRHAALVLQPSLFEGWSTVVEDAKAIGRPIFASDLAVHREQLEHGRAAVPARFFAPEDDGALAALLSEVWPSLAAGPDADAERAAAARNADDRIAAARQFLGIVRDAMAIERAA